MAQETERPIGINLNNVSLWDPQQLFVDVKKQSIPWLVQDVADTQWSIDSIAVPLRADGYPTHVPFLHDGDSLQVHTLMLADLPYLYESGTYTLMFEGSGELHLDHDVADEVYTQAGTYTFHVDTPSTAGIHLTIVRSDSTNPIRNIRIIKPGYADTYEDDPFHPRILELLSRFEVIRFMKPLEVEESEIQHWEERTTMNYHTQWSVETGGMAVEYVAELSNTVGADAWINIPFRATDDYVENFARTLHQGLDESRRVYIEYANEIWNSEYPVLAYSQEQGMALGLDDDPVRAGHLFAAKRSFEIFKIFEDVFSEEDRLVHVLAGQGAWPDVAENMLQASQDATLNPDNIDVDAIAIAPYFGWGLGRALHDRGEAGTISAAALLDSLEATMPAEVVEMVNSHNELAETYEVDLISYESGQGIVGFEDTPDSFIEVMHAVNRDERMEDLYCQMYDIWYENGAGLNVAFTLMDRYSRWGAYGVLEHLDQDVSTAPKWQAFETCVFAQTTARINEPAHPNEVHLFQNYPNPFATSTTISYALPRQTAVHIAVYDLMGRLVLRIDEEMKAPGMHHVTWDASNMAPGVYWYRIQAGELIQSQKMVVVR